MPRERSLEVITPGHLLRLHLRPRVGPPLPDEVARPEGFERTRPTFVIESLEEMVEALLAA